MASMPRSPLGLKPPVEDYLNAQKREHPVLVELREATATVPYSMMQIAPNQGVFLDWLIRSMGAKRCIEVGVYTGYSSLVTALALPDDGYLLACDVSEEWTALAREHWARAGVDHKIELVLQPAQQTLQARVLAGASNSFDFAFIDADKSGYLDYFELCLRLLRPGGVLAFDNMLWGGQVAERSNQEANTRALREVNRRVLADSRVTTSLVPVGDGILLATKR